MPPQETMTRDETVLPAGHALFHLEVEGVDRPLSVAKVAGREAVSELFEIDLTLVAADDALPFREMVGRSAALTLESAAGPRVVRGMLGRVEQGDPIPVGDTPLTAYHARLVPRAWVLLLRRDSRVFQGLTVPAILEAVLQGAGFRSPGHDYRMAISRAHAPREYCVQYRESDWAFMRRLMADEGIYAFFDPGSGSDTLVLADRSLGSPEIPWGASLAFRRPHGDAAVSSFRVAEELRPGKVTLRGYDFERPALPLTSVARSHDGGHPHPAGRRDADIEVYDHPSDYVAADGGGARARLALEQIEATSARIRGASRCPRLVPGLVFALTDHPSDDVNGRYLVTSVDHDGAEPVPGHGGEPAHYQNRFTAIPAAVPLRPLAGHAGGHDQAASPKPVIHGVQSAVVVGPPGEEIHTDALGRIKVQFPWDRLGARDDRSSCWVRVAQLAAGAGFGAMNVPRVGQEVLVEFVDGDPDRPIVVGRVYDGRNLPPYALPAHKTRSTIKSSSTPGGGGSNELRFEDAAGREEVFLHAQKDLQVAVENDAESTVGRDASAEIARHKNVAVGVDHTATVGQDESIEVGRDRSRKVGHDDRVEVGGDRTLAVAHADTTTVGDDQRTGVGGDQEVHIGRDQVTSVGGDRTLTVTGSDRVDVRGDARTTVLGSRAVEVSGDQSETVDGNEARTVHGNAEATVGGSHRLAVSGTMTASADGDVDVTAGVRLTQRAETEMLLQVGACTLRIAPDELVITAGETSIKISRDGIQLSSDQTIALDGNKIKLN